MTVMQIQCLLTFLGYGLAPDGILGPRTEEAVRAFQKEYALTVDGDAGQVTCGALRQAVAEGWTRPVCPGAGPAWWQEIRYFRRSDPYIGCSCGRCGGFPEEPEKELMVLADQVREHFGVPMVPSSTVRCEKHNAAVGGVKNSRHLRGKAMDFSLRGVPAERAVDYIRTLPQMRYTYAIGKGHVHMDIE